jgi:hypothetical protein
MDICMNDDTIPEKTLNMKLNRKYLQGKGSWYSDWLQAGQLKGRSSSPGRVKNFLFSTSSRLVLGPTQPLIQWASGVKQLGHEADYLSPTSTEAKKMWIYTSTPPYTFMV